MPLTPERREELRESLTVYRRVPATQYTQGEWKRSWLSTTKELLDALAEAEKRGEDMKRLHDSLARSEEQAHRDLTQAEKRAEEAERELRAANIRLAMDTDRTRVEHRISVLEEQAENWQQAATMALSRAETAEAEVARLRDLLDRRETARVIYAESAGVQKP